MFSLLACFAVGLCVGYLVFRLRSTAQGKAALGSLGQIASTIAELELNLRQQRMATEDARRRADEYFGKIDGCVREATQAKSLLIRTGAEHGAAQGLMLREIESLSIQYRRLSQLYREVAGKPPPRPEPILDPRIQIVADEFREQHVTPYQSRPAPATSPAAG